MNDFATEIRENMKPDLTYHSFKRFMLKNGYWNKFCYNFNSLFNPNEFRLTISGCSDMEGDQIPCPSSVDKYIRVVVEYSNPYFILSDAFDWFKSPEGNGFWHKVDEELWARFS